MVNKQMTMSSSHLGLSRHLKLDACISVSIKLTLNVAMENGEWEIRKTGLQNLKLGHHHEGLLSFKIFLLNTFLNH
jgi:hypothetical protein